MTKPAAAAESGQASDVSLLHRCDRATRSRRPSNACCRRSGSASSRRVAGSRPNGSWPPGSGYPARRCARRSVSCTKQAGSRSGAAARRHVRASRAERRSRRGGSVVGHGAPLSLGELDDVLTFRWVVEVGAAERAAGRDMTAAARRELAAHLAAVGSASPGDHRRFDSRLHLALAEATGSRSLVRAVADAKTQVNMLLDRIPLLSPNLEHSNEQHREIGAGRARWRRAGRTVGDDRPFGGDRRPAAGLPRLSRRRGVATLTVRDPPLGSDLPPSATYTNSPIEAGASAPSSACGRTGHRLAVVTIVSASAGRRVRATVWAPPVLRRPNAERRSRGRAGLRPNRCGRCPL